MNKPKKLESMADENIMLVCKDADDQTVRKCVEILAKRYQEAVFNYIYRIVRDREAAEDLSQETFVRVFNKSREFKSVAKFSTWLYRIATNLALNEIRDRKMRPSLSLYSPPERERGEGELIALLPAPGAESDTDLQRRELARLIENTLLAIPEKYRLVLILCDMEGFSYQETARILRTRSGTIGSRLSRARRYFVEKFKPHSAGQKGEF